MPLLRTPFVAVMLLTLMTVPAGAADVPCDRPGCEAWVARYDAAGEGEQVKALSVGPEGERIYVTGWVRISTQYRWGTVAYDAITGERVWATHAPPVPGDINVPEAMVVGPDDGRVYVVGRVGGGPGLNTADFGLRAYDAHTGEELWLATYNGPADGQDSPRAVAVSSDGSRVFVAGDSQGPVDIGLSETSTDFAIVAFNAATGERLWDARYDGAEMADNVVGLAVSPGDDRVFVTGNSSSVRFANAWDLTTLSYDAATGDRLWEARYHGPGQSIDTAAGIALSDDGSRVFVGGTSDVGGRAVIATVAYDAASGREAWVSRLDHPWIRAATASAVHLDPTGAPLYVTGRSAEVPDIRVSTEPGPGAGWDSRLTVVAYDPTDGEELWTTARGVGHADVPMAVAASPEGGLAVAAGYTTGPDQTLDRVTLALHAVTGQEVWLAGPNDPGESAWAGDVEISPDGDLAFVAGTAGPATNRDFIVSAYRMGSPPPAPHIVDPAGDANGLGEAAPDDDRRPLSADPADLRWARLETSYVALPVGEDGIDYVPTGLEMHLGTTAAPRADGPTIEYKLRTRLDECDSQFVSTLRGPLALPTDRPDGQVSWIQLDDSCPDGIGVFTDATWTAEVDQLGREIVIAIPFDSLTGERAKVLSPGRVLVAPRAASETPAAGVVQVGEILPGRVDRTVAGPDFTIGSDVPPDVPCTRDCP